MANTRIKIKVHDVIVEAPRDMVISADTTPDGLVINFKGGSHLVVPVTGMPQGVKDLITSTVQKFNAKNSLLEVDVYNGTTPTKISILD